MTSVPHSGAKSVTPGGSVAGGGHTKGPWDIEAGFLITRGFCGGAGIPLLHFEGTADQEGDAYGWLTGKPEQHRANEVLIAAAPELLDVAIKSHEPYVGLDEEDIRCLYGADEADLAMALRAAIAKATAGETRNAEGAL